MNGPVRDAAERNLPGCPVCFAARGDPCRTASCRTRWPHRERLVGFDAPEVRLVLANDQPYPLRDVLTKLTGAARHLLADHDCDAHGYEELGAVIDAATTIIHRIDALKGGE